MFGSDRYKFGSPPFAKVGFSPDKVKGLRAYYKADAQVYTDGAIQFTASDKGYLSIADASQTGLDPLTGDYSYSFWVNPTSLVGGNLIGKFDGSGYILDYNASGLIEVIHSDGTGNAVQDSATGTLTTGTWQNYTVVANRAGNLYVYKNGNTASPVITLNISGKTGSLNASADFTLANRSGLYFNGSMDSFGFWNRALTAAEVSSLYNSGSGKTYSDLTTSEKTSIVSFWNFNEESGIRYDAHGTNHLSQVFSNIIDNTSTLGSELVTNGTFSDVFTEKVTNGGFDSGTTGWAPAAVTLASVAGGASGNCLEITNSGSEQGYALQAIATVVGVTYTINWQHKNGTSGASSYIVIAGNALNNGNNAAWTAKSATFVATDTSPYIILYNGNAVPGATTYIDSVSVTMSGWTSANATLTSEAGGQSGNCLKITNAGGQGFASTSFTTVANQNYTLSFYHKNVSPTGGQALIGTGIRTGNIADVGQVSNANWTLKTYNFKATTTTTWVDFIQYGNANGDSVLFDTVSVKALTQTNLNGGFESLGAGETLGSELLSNPGFETAGGGGADVFGSWAETAGSGAIADDVVTPHSGAHDALLTYVTGQAYVTNTFVTTASTRYKVTFWTKGDGTNAGRYQIYDITNAAVIITAVTTGVTAATWTLVTAYFTTPSGCISTRVDLFSPSVAGFAQFDDVSIKQVTAYVPFLNWISFPSGLSTVDVETTAPYAGTYAARIDVGTSGFAYQYVTAIGRIGSKYKLSAYIKSSSASTIRAGDTSTLPVTLSTTTSYVLNSAYFTATATDIGFFASDASKSIYIDDVTLICTEIPATAGIASGLSIDGNLCASFNGTTQYLSVASNASLQTGDIDFTWFGWLNMADKAISAGQDIINKYDGYVNKRELEFQYLRSSDRFRVLLSSNGSSVSTLTANNFGSPNPNQWYFFVLQYNSTTDLASLTFNSGTADTVSHASGIFVSDARLTIGATIAADNKFAGRLDGFGFIKRLLTAGEITAIYNNGKGVKYAGLPSTLTSTLENRVIYSDDPSHSPWNAQRATRSASGILETAASGTHTLYQNSISIPASTSFTYSAKVTPVGGRNAGIGNSTSYVIYTLSTQAVLSSSITAGGTSSCTDNGDGSYTLKLTVTESTAQTEIYVFVANASGISYAGDITKGLSISNIQVRESSASSAYVATTTTSVLASLCYWNLDEYSAGTGAVTRNDSTHNAMHLTSVGNTPSGQGVNYYEGTVSRWLDNSGNAKTLIQTTQSARLLYVTNAQAGRPVLRGDGLTKNLNNASDLIGTGDVTVFAVVKPRDWGGATLGSILNNARTHLRFSSVGIVQVSSDNLSTIATSGSSSISLGTPYVVIVTRTSANPGLANIYINGVLSGLADQNTGTPTAGFATYIGNTAAGTRGFDGDIDEVGIVSRILTAVEIGRLNTALRAKWGI